MKVPVLSLYTDNSSTASIATNPVLHQRTKHIEIDVHTVRDKVLFKEIKIQKIETRENVTDTFTKEVFGTLFKHLREKLKMKDFHVNTRSQ